MEPNGQNYLYILVLLHKNSTCLSSNVHTRWAASVCTTFGRQRVRENFNNSTDTGSTRQSTAQRDVRGMVEQTNNLISATLRTKRQQLIATNRRAIWDTVITQGPANLQHTHITIVLTSLN